MRDLIRLTSGDGREDFINPDMVAMFGYNAEADKTYVHVLGVGSGRYPGDQVKEIYDAVCGVGGQYERIKH